MSRTVTHGLSFLPDVDPSHQTPGDYYDMLLDLSVLGDEAGLSHVKITEHYLRAYGGYCPNPLTFLAAVAARTQQIRLMTGCLLPVFHHPIALASETAMVDALSGGRLDVGVARAYMPYEFDAFGIPLDESRDRFDDTVGTMVRLWQEESVDSDSRFFSFADATILPRPVQAPHPPVWVAAVRTEASFVAAGERGYGLLITPSLSPLPQMASLVAKYRANFRPAHPGDEARVLASLPVFVGETDEHALSVGDPLLAHYLEIWARSADSWDERRSGDYVGYTGMGKGIRSVPVEYLRTVGGAVVGGPQTVVDRISAIQATIGADGYLWQVDFGGVDHRTARTSVERLCTDVIPNLDLFV